MALSGVKLLSTSEFHDDPDGGEKSAGGVFDRTQLVACAVIGQNELTLGVGVPDEDVVLVSLEIVEILEVDI